MRRYRLLSRTDGLLAEASERAYSEATHRAGNTQALLWLPRRGSRLAVLAVRGTERDGWEMLRDVVTDARAYPWLDTVLGVWAHRGFQEAARDLWPVVHPELVSLARLGYRTAFTGHSLGAALATYLAAIAARSDLAPCLKTTFGEPRPGFRGLAAITRSVPGRRYVHGNDVVARVPPLVPAVRLVLWWRHDRPGTAIGEPGDGLSDHRVAFYRRPRRPGQE